MNLLPKCDKTKRTLFGCVIASELVIRIPLQTAKRCVLTYLLTYLLKFTYLVHIHVLLSIRFRYVRNLNDL